MGSSSSGCTQPIPWLHKLQQGRRSGLSSKRLRRRLSACNITDMAGGEGRFQRHVSKLRGFEQTDRVIKECSSSEALFNPRCDPSDSSSSGRVARIDGAAVLHANKCQHDGAYHPRFLHGSSLWCVLERSSVSVAKRLTNVSRAPRHASGACASPGSVV